MSFLLTLLRPYLLHIVAGLAVLAMAGGVYAYIYHKGAQAVREEALRQEMEYYKATVEKANRIARELEGSLQAARQREDQLKERLRDETSRNPVYRSCIVPADGVRILDDALAGKSRSTR